MHKCVLVLKSQDNLAPGSHYRYFVKNSRVHSYYTRRHDLHLPKPKNNIRKRTLRYSGTVYFNALPNEIKHSLSLSTFK